MDYVPALVFGLILVTAFFTPTILNVFASTFQDDKNKVNPNCFLGNVSKKYLYNGVNVSEVEILGSECSERLLGVMQDNQIFLNENKSENEKIVVLKHEYCHWLKRNDVNRNVFIEETECFLTEYM